MANPQITPFTEARHAGGFMVSESRGRRARDQATLITGQKLDAGTVLGTVLGTTGTAAALRTNTGNPTFGAINVLAPAVAGVYVLTMETATTFVVSDPSGSELPGGTLGSAYAQGGLSFTLTAGGTPAVQGDAFTITTIGKKAAYDPTKNDGSEVADSILWDFADATNADQPIAIISNDAEVNASELVWGAGVTTAGQKTAGLAQLRALGIKAR